MIENIIQLGIQLLHTCHFYSSIRYLCNNNIMRQIVIVNNSLKLNSKAKR